MHYRALQCILEQTQMLMPSIGLKAEWSQIASQQAMRYYTDLMICL